MCGSAQAVRSGGRSKAPLRDNNWPAGSLELANLPSRIGFMMSDPGQTTLYYQGDSAAFQTALDKLAAIRAANVQLIVRDGPYRLPGGGWAPPDMAGERVDWIFTVVNPETWNRILNNPSRVAAGAADGGGRAVPSPTLIVYLGGGGIDFTAIKLPGKLDITDERADAAGFNNGPVVQADVYNLQTSKPIPGARLAVGSLGPQNAWTLVKEIAADAAGHADLTGFEPGQYQIAAFAEGYAPRAAGYIEFRHNTLKRLSIFLSPITAASGIIVDDGGQPMAGVKVSVPELLAPDGSEYTIPTPSSFATGTDDNGRFTLSGLPTGSFRLYASNATHVQTERLKLLAAPGANLVVKMIRAGSIRGKVLDSQGNPLARAVVHLNVPGPDRVGTFGGATQVQADGTFLLTKVPPGHYLLSNSPAPRELEPNAKVSEVDVKAGEQTEAILHW
jgi:hypothetical protein